MLFLLCAVFVVDCVFHSLFILVVELSFNCFSLCDFQKAVRFEAKERKHPNMKIRLLVDDRWFGFHGIGRYAHEVLSRFQKGNLEIIKLEKNFSIKNPLSPLYLAAAIKQKKPDIFWSPGYMPPIKSNVPFVLTIHDLIHLHFASIAHKAYYNLVLKPLSMRAFKIITISEYSRQEILKWGGYSSEQVVVLPNGVDSKFQPQGVKHDIGAPYILYIGNRKQHKNLDRLLQAFAKSGISKNIRLAISGVSDPTLFNKAKKIGIGNRLTFLGFIQEEDLPAVYRGAIALALVSLYEGFGLPPLEAMACGTPVLTSNVTSLPEVVGEAGIMVDPYDVEAIADGLRRLVEDYALHKELRRKGLERTQQFTWERTAEHVWQILQEAAKRG